MYLRSMLTQLPRITHNSVVRSCSHKINSQPTESPSDWQTIYNFPSIKFLAQLSKLKIYQSIVTVAGIPLLIGLESYQYVPAQTTELFAMLGMCSEMFLKFESFQCLCFKESLEQSACPFTVFALQKLLVLCM